MREGRTLEKIPIQKIARVLGVLVTVTLICNFIALLLVPTFVALKGNLLELLDIWNDPQDPVNPLAVVFLMWLNMFLRENIVYEQVLTLFLLFSGCCTAVILWQARRVLNTILRGEPFALENAVSLRRAAVFCFLIAGAALVRVIFSVCYYRSPQPLATYNALFVPMFAMAGLLCLVMSALFRQAAELKAENDLTI